MVMAIDGKVEIAQQDIARYRVAWSNYVRRRDLVLLVCIGYIPWGVGVIVGVRLGLPDTAARILIIGWFSVIPVAILRWLLWRCPRCGGYFSFPGWYAKYLSQKCVGCGLSKKEIKAVLGGPNG
jgi:hypothetical protein